MSLKQVYYPLEHIGPYTSCGTAVYIDNAFAATIPPGGSSQTTAIVQQNTGITTQPPIGQIRIQNILYMPAGSAGTSPLDAYYLCRPVEPGDVGPPPPPVMSVNVTFDNAPAQQFDVKVTSTPSGFQVDLV